MRTCISPMQAPERFQPPMTKQLVDFVLEKVGDPDYSLTLTFRPVFGPRRSTTKVSDARQAILHFLRLLNDKCFGQGHRRRGLEVGFYVAFEGLGVHEELHCHAAIRLPLKLSRQKFLRALNFALRHTKRLGPQHDLQPYYHGWIGYTMKTGSDSFQPELLRRGTP